MKKLKFLKDFDCEISPVKNFWRLKKHKIPSSPGVYLLITKPGITFQYPEGKSPIYYIGEGDSLYQRLRQHLKHHLHVKNNKRQKNPLYMNLATNMEAYLEVDIVLSKHGLE
jgi:excinuclease UvrABC nuclease subunit